MSSKIVNTDRKRKTDLPILSTKAIDVEILIAKYY